MIKSRNGLSANGGVPTLSDHHDHVFQFLIMVFIVSVKRRMECNITRFQESVAFNWYWKMVLMVSMFIYTVLTPYENQWYDFNKEFCRPDPCENWGSYHNAGDHPNVGNLLSNCVPLKWDSILIKRIYGLIHKFSRSINVFSTTFYFSSDCV